MRIAKKFYGDRNARVVSRRVGEVERKLTELERDQVAKPPRPLHFAGLGAEADSKRQGIAVSAAGITVKGRLSPVSFRLEPGEHLLVTGANGTGKSTLLQVLAGLLPPSSGEVTALDARGSIGMLHQEVFLPDPHQRGLARTATQAYADAVGEAQAEAVPLANFGLLEPRDLNRPLASLSVGQHRRVELASLLAHPPHLLLLDEPTNHLSLALATALEEQIPDYPGTVIVASHDRWLRARWQGRILPLQGSGSSGN
ncbi:ATP-binding cassette domain-containing protein [Actinomyces minihominis]|uniref:ATP-binding cassette domain-containing protein n=1 Tax=Actinomyces minihominis TaxID=2002838 RepID=UPI0013ED27F5|nr:ATP-binding cassette domain-containing protein [Actinomyces minihominis]